MINIFKGWLINRTSALIRGGFFCLLNPGIEKKRNIYVVLFNNIH